MTHLFCLNHIIVACLYPSFPIVFQLCHHPSKQVNTIVVFHFLQDDVNRKQVLKSLCSVVSRQPASLHVSHGQQLPVQDSLQTVSGVAPRLGCVQWCNDATLLPTTPTPSDTPDE
jgi:hypothetical protein